MTPEQWRAVQDLFAAALEIAPAARDRWLTERGTDPVILAEVRSLLRAHASDEAFLSGTAAQADARQDAAVAGVRLTAAAPLLVPGAVVGQYRIRRVLGQGGMGVVYEAEDLRLHRAVALKAVAPDLAGDERVRLRLKHEARAAAALSHPAVATVYALEEIDGSLFIATECLDGETLRAEIARGPLPPRLALDTAHTIAQAMAAAHARGVIHRDLKPENVMRTRDGQVKVLDFGLAQLAPDAFAGSSTRLTDAGAVLGTPAYMAPEQLAGQGVDARVDQFAFGIMLFELVTGQHPFGGGSMPSVIARIMASDGLPESPANLALPAWAAPIVQRCLRQRPDDRYPTTMALVEALEATRQAASTPAAATRPPAAGGAAPEPPGPQDARWWWRFHQLATAVAYWTMVAPAWHVHQWLPWGRPWFFACLAAVIVAANVRLHLRFTAGVLPSELRRQRALTSGWVRLADWGYVTLLAGAGLVLADAHGGWAALLIGFAIGAAVAFVVIEPTTTRAAFAES